MFLMHTKVLLSLLDILAVGQLSSSKLLKLRKADLKIMQLAISLKLTTLDSHYIFNINIIDDRRLQGYIVKHSFYQNIK